MIIFMSLLCQATLGLYIGRPLSNINFGSIRKDVPSHFFHSHFGNAKDVPIFVVESITSPVITRITRREKIVTAFVDPRDAIDYLTELTQAGSAVEYDLPSLRIRILTLQELFEKIDPTKPRISSHIKYKLVPSSSQLPLASLYVPLSYKKDVHIPLFYSKALNISPTEGKVLTPLFWDFADLTAYINMISDVQYREALIKSIGILSLFDILLVRFLHVRFTVGTGKSTFRRLLHGTKSAGFAILPKGKEQNSVHVLNKGLKSADFFF